MAKNGRSERNIFGDGYDHYDASGNKKGSSERNLFGDGYTNYSENTGCCIPLLILPAVAIISMLLK